mgnify:CR=1 FL=1
MAALPAEEIESRIYPAGFYRRKAQQILEISRLLLDRHRMQGDQLVIITATNRSLESMVATERFRQDLLFRLNSQKQTTFLIATHNRELAERSDREVRMADGRIEESRDN